MLDSGKLVVSYPRSVLAMCLGSEVAAHSHTKGRMSEAFPLLRQSVHGEAAKQSRDLLLEIAGKRQVHLQSRLRKQTSLGEERQRKH